jgi:DNA polymerase-3 subunit alpha
VRNTFEAITCLALYRPAMLDSGMTKKYLEARASKQPYLIHPGVDGICKDTWGVPVFQDQVIDIMRACGLSYGDLNDIIKAVKASGGKITEYAVSIFNRIHPVFVRAACQTLPSCHRADAERIWQTVTEFREYGFNKAHATAYGLLGYRMAYMKVHHPLEFMGALLSTWSGVDHKERRYSQEARRMGLKLGRPDVNRSDLDWSVDDKGVIRKGLRSVKGVGESAAVTILEDRAIGGPYTTIEELIARVPARPVSGGKNWQKDQKLKGVLQALRQAGALNSLGVGPE